MTSPEGIFRDRKRKADRVASSSPPQIGFGHKTSSASIIQFFTSFSSFFANFFIFTQFYFVLRKWTFDAP
jgi:hypothetical protein